MSLLTKIFGDYSQKELKRIVPIQKKVLALEEEYSALSDAELQAKPPNSKRDSQTGRLLTIFCRRLLPHAVRLRGEFLI